MLLIVIYWCWTRRPSSVEQPTSAPIWFWTVNLSPVAEDASVLLRTSAPSDCCLTTLHLHYITYVPFELCQPSKYIWNTSRPSKIHSAPYCQISRQCGNARMNYWCFSKFSLSVFRGAHTGAGSQRACTKLHRIWGGCRRVKIKFAFDFRYFALFWNEGDLKGELGSKIEDKFSNCWPL